MEKKEAVRVSPVKKQKKPSASVQKMLTHPLEYADGAIEELTRQLSNARTEKRKKKLENKIQMWKQGKAALLKAIKDRMEKQAEIASAAEADKKELAESSEDNIDNEKELPSEE